MSHTTTLDVNSKDMEKIGSHFSSSSHYDLLTVIRGLREVEGSDFTRCSNFTLNRFVGIIRGFVQSCFLHSFRQLLILEKNEGKDEISFKKIV